MKLQDRIYRRRKPETFLVGLLAVFCLFAVSACGGGNNSSHVYDNAHVLDVSSVQKAASNLSYPLDIYTTNTFAGNQSTFQSTTFSKLNGDANRVVMAIDTTHRYLYIAKGSNVPLSRAGINEGVSAFSSHFGNNDYTGATLSTIDSLQQSLGSSGSTEGGNAFSGLSTTFLCGGLLLLGIILVAFGAFRRRRRFSGPTMPYSPPMGPYNQGNYYAPPNQGGMNPWAAGGLGAAAGGFLGYELGKEAGEREAEQRNDWSGGGGDFGGGGSFGGGGDFGGGDSGGGGNF